MDLITSLLLLLVASRVLGKIFKSLGYFPIIGEVLAGFLLGPAVFGFIKPTEGLNGIVELAIFLLIFAAGLEVDLKDFIRSLKGRAVIGGLISFVASFSIGLTLGTTFGWSLSASVIVGLCFSITSIPVALSFLNSLKLIDSKVGHSVMGTAVVLEILSMLILGISFDMHSDSSILDFIKLVFAKGFYLFLFFFLVMMVNKILRSEFRHIQRTQRLFSQLINYMGEEAVFGVGVLFVLLFSTFSEALGFHFIIGSFFGGLLLNKDIIGTNFFQSLTHTLESITKHFLTPIFFAYLGLLVQTGAFKEGVLIAVILGVGYLVKIGSSWFGARVAKFSNTDALKIGVILNSRGTFDLIVADLGLSRGYISSDIFSILVLFGLFSVVINPILYRRLFLEPEKEESPPPSLD